MLSRSFVFVLSFPESSGHLVKGETYAKVCSQLEITDRMLDLLGREILVARGEEKKKKKNLIMNCS